MTKNNKPIGIFDSGLGGLTILKQVHKLMPKENLIYFGDTAHVPYGSKSKQTVQEYSLNIAKFLESKNIKMLVIACNSASALAINTVKKHSKVPVIGVIEPGAFYANQKTKNKRVAVIATEATIKSDAYKKALKRLDKGLKISQTPSPLFVPLIEEGLISDKITHMVAEKYLAKVKKNKPDTIILGCTHYPVIKKLISKVVGKNIYLIDSAESVAKKVKQYLSNKDMLKKTGAGKMEVFASDSPERFKKLSKFAFGSPLKTVKLKKLI
ncbi:MAG: glutamate racemase [Elusimicrobiaceae bacterium]|jgi:glutamate racemase|nr:glutamate racemase [Elusimicrobiaceae bacterium]MBT3954687.1 glutamate racemase [Elusimicrobiaceae bacterium]MBT4008051.1 glutamate racemase [Elusimicrobiaceae bacterium]MBT4402610.1 glutamate racemase [Elusimicrobiaceae bacterium]MBT4439365.1 glutamate racemase [Elusimicrobiaceae bacterium]